MRAPLFAPILALAVLLARATPAAGPTPVDLALVLVSDVSRSIDDAEFELQKQGYRAAFQDPRVLAAIRNGPLGAIAVAYVEFAGDTQVRTVMGWRIVRDPATATAMAAEIVAAPRSFYGRTSISAGIDQAVALIRTAPLEPTRRVIDVAGDGTNNAGRDVTAARDDAIEAGIVINGLAIINDHPVSYTYAHVQPAGGLAEWYSRNVIGGQASFVVEIHDFNTFTEALTRKLLQEIAALPPSRSPT